MMDELCEQFGRIAPCLGLRGMGGATVETEFQSEGSGSEATLAHHDFAFLETGQVVQTISHIWFDLLKLRVVNNGLRALSGLFGRLEEQHHLALVGALLAEPLG